MHYLLHVRWSQDVDITVAKSSVDLYFCTWKKRLSRAIVNVCLLLLYNSFAIQAKLLRQALSFSYIIAQYST